MAKAKAGDTVRVHYTGWLEDGTVFDSSADRDPLEFQLGEGQVIEGFEEAIVGMEVGESKTANILPEKGYGPHYGEMVIEVGREQFPPHIAPQVDQVLQLQRPDGDRIRAIITNVSESTVTLDANHPLAGKNLMFDIELLEIV
ncbi:MAG: peptidylprolyl isomerase [Candidatus Abyssobacteria bacterium SURF_17]|uniref:Peptidyl-prolyl cis-trans isomerase n=1 Tax=Candidatus Abyssobacteria bacterium SURF_17 TaxID=2093361 RepID=A0A419EW65_9BACT|nr:MAG: peptidylprolyl isomerase [Candidatus Abyssubacteria bacterium SURF_17]